MNKPDFTLENAQGFVVFSDDDTYEGLSSGSTVLLVEGEFDCGARDQAIGDVLSNYDIGRHTLEEMGQPHLDPMIPVEVQSDDGACKVRAVSVDFLLQYYLTNRTKGGSIGVPVEKK